MTRQCTCGFVPRGPISRAVAKQHAAAVVKPSPRVVAVEAVRQS